MATAPETPSSETDPLQRRLPSPGSLFACTLLVIVAAAVLWFGLRYQRQRALIQFIEEQDGRCRKLSIFIPQDADLPVEVGESMISRIPITHNEQEETQ